MDGSLGSLGFGHQTACKKVLPKVLIGSDKSGTKDTGQECHVKV